MSAAALLLRGMVLSAALTPSSAGAGGRGGSDPTVVLGMRSYVGRFTPSSREFLGIQYAQQPVGALRWFPAQPLPALDEPLTIDAHSKFGPICLQRRGSPLALNPDGSQQRYGEACLVLNVFTPHNTTAASR